MRERQQKDKKPPRYDNKCRNISQNEAKERVKKGESYVIRQKMPEKGEVTVFDELRGEIKFNAVELEDNVLLKSDGFPTYQLAVVVDDHLMAISHVVRGEDWIPSFPKNVLLYKSFGWPLPKFIHLPIVLNKGGGKLSKRQGDTAVEDYRAKGYLPEALLNFIVLLGWSPQAGAAKEKLPDQEETKEIMTLKQMIERFDYAKIGTSPAVFDTEKLDYLNGWWIRQKSEDELLELCRPYLAANLDKATDETRKGEHFIKQVIRLEQERLKKLSEIGELTEFFFTDKLDYAPELLIWKKSDREHTKENLIKVHELLEKIPEANWTNDSIEDAIISYLKAKEFKVGDYLWPMRAALTGRQASPGPFDVAEVLGKKISLERIKEGIGKL